MFSKLLLAAALVGVANAQTCSDINGDSTADDALTCLANSVAKTGAESTSCAANPCTTAADNDKCCTASDGYFSDSTADANAVTPCDAVANAATVTCTAAGNSVAATCDAGYSVVSNACSADTTTCDAATPTGGANMVNVGGVAKASTADECDGTATDATCAHTCAAGYTGGSVTCQGDGSWAVVDCTEVSGKCSGNFATATNLATQVNSLFQYDCGAGYTVKGSTVALSGVDAAAMKAACCSPVTCSNTTGAAWVTAACVCEGGAAISSASAICAPAEGKVNGACAAANANETTCTDASIADHPCEFTPAVSAALAGDDCDVVIGGKCTAGAAGQDAVCATAPAATTAAATTAAATTAAPAAPTAAPTADLSAGEDSATLGVASALAATAVFARFL